MFIERLVDNGKPPFTALVAYNDYMAEYAMTELHVRGIQVPQDISIAGFDGVLPSRLHEHAQITTSATPLKELGAASVQRLQQRIKAPHEPRKKIVLPTTFEEGETTAPVSA
jgi:LacI family transcriptional regulator